MPEGMVLKIGMVGGGRGAFIGAVHRIALAMDGAFELVAGCFSRDFENTLATGQELGLDRGRCYRTFEEMAEREAAMPPDQRLAAVAIVTPNRAHFAPARLFLERGFHVICDKPLCWSLQEAEQLVALVEQTGLRFALTHNYTGYPMVREAKERIALGELGTIRKVYVEYLQGWLSEPLEQMGQKQAAWRTDPAEAGPAGALGDIGTHAFNLLEHVTGIEVRSLFAKMATFVEGRRLDDDAMVMLELEGGATGILCASQVCFGRENGLMLRVFGTAGALSWQQEHPNDLHLTDAVGSVRILRTATSATSPGSRALSRLPAGHPEGYLEAFANIYRAFAADLNRKGQVEPAYPTVRDGLRGMRFIDACLRSARAVAWSKL